ncbi:MAG: YkgJ family cysteine cluster protein [Tissierellaceae bacterium]|nr:YkgJ family cysteine cluster protein [Tissierellaceae bacterium]
MNDNDRKMEQVLNNRLGENDTFEFGCNQCGECCRNRYDIVLSPYDLYRIAKYLKMKIPDVLRKYCESYMGENSNMPVVRAKPKIHNDVCSFLRNGKCSIHEAKPSVCALFPLGRAADSKGEIRYFYGGGCTNANKSKVSLKDWIGMFNLKESEEPTKLWGKAITKLSVAKSLVKKDAEKEEMFNNLAYITLYQNYDTDKDFLPQFSENIKIVYFAFEKLFGKSIEKAAKGAKINGFGDF